MDFVRNYNISVANVTNRRIKENNMIEKLEIKKVPVPNNPTLAKNVGMDNESLFDKINELVDVVNKLYEEVEDNARTRADHEHKIEELQEFADVADKNLAKLMEDATREENVQDKFAEQRKWVGKLCRFWDNQEEYKFVGILGEVSDNGTYFQKDDIISYLNCEPVKPDDDIIYKGEDNENN